MAAEKQNCMIIGASPIESGRIFHEYDPKSHYVICADAGFETAEKYHIKPDLIVGDFDSAKKKPPEDVRVFNLPVQKDVTDTMYAVMRGLAKGFRNFVLLGCLGGQRLDHTFANLEVLQYLKEHGGRGVLADSHTKVFLLRDEKLKMTGARGSTVSVFPYRGVSCNVSYSGLEYPLNHESLVCGGVLMGVSNSITADDAEIRVHTGTALVLIYKP